MSTDEQAKKFSVLVKEILLSGVDFLVVATRFRISRQQSEDLDQIEAAFARNGYRKINRSALMRHAISAFITQVYREFPEIRGDGSKDDV
jgi:hypothetical protein